MARPYLHLDSFLVFKYSYLYALDYSYLYALDYFNYHALCCPTLWLAHICDWPKYAIFPITAKRSEKEVMKNYRNEVSFFVWFLFCLGGLFDVLFVTKISFKIQNER